MEVRDTSEAKAGLSAPIDAVQTGSGDMISNVCQPATRSVDCHGSARPRVPGAMAGEISISADFDTLPDDVAEAFS